MAISRFLRAPSQRRSSTRGKPTVNKLKTTALFLILCGIAPSLWAAAVGTDVSVTKTDGVTSAVPGLTVLTYTIVVSNSGMDTTGVSVSDTFPAGLTCTWTCAASAGSTCTAMGVGDINDTVDLLDSGTATYTATCSIASSATGTLSNTATASGGSVADPNAANNSATDSDTVLVPTADLAISKVDSADPVNQGAAYSYTITVTNAGPSDATSVVATETLPAGVTFVSSSGCAEDPSANPTCTLGTITAGGMAAYTLNVTAPNASGQVTNSVTVSSAATDPTSGNDTATETTDVNPAADLAITKTDGVVTAVAGETVTYTITATNNGPDDVTGATVADTFPADLTCTWTCAASAGSSCTAAGSGDINDTAVDLLNGGTATYTVTCDIASSATGTLSNTATVSSSVFDSVPGNNSATDGDTVLTASADLSITKVDSADPVNQGAAYSYTITVTNAGPSDATSVVATEALPAGVTFVSSSGCAEDPTANPTCTLGTIAAGGMAAYTLNVTAPNASGQVTNSVTVSSATADPDSGNDTATETTDVNPEADLAITKTDGVVTAVAGETVTYTITATNNGPDDVTGATVADTFPADLTCTWTCAASAGSSCTAAGSGDINDTAVDLLNGGTATYTATCDIAPSATGTLSNTATVSSSVLDAVPGNNSATDGDTVLTASADLSISSMVSPNPVDLGGLLTITVLVDNAGPSDAPDVVVTSTLDPAITFDSTTGCVEDPNGVPTCTLGLVPAGGSASFQITATAPNDGGDFSALFDVSSSATDPDGANNSETGTVQVGSVVDIPTATTWGLFAMIALLTAAAVRRLRV
ncbi:MAG: hypothetical protein AAGC60_25310 [Acidobacteriota bacterium]